VRFLTVDGRMMDGWTGREPAVPVLRLTRRMAPPWVRDQLGSEMFKS
jgi:hypothetical protein